MTDESLIASLRAELGAEIRSAMNWWDVLEPLASVIGAAQGHVIPWNDVLQPGVSVHVLPGWQTRFPSSKVEFMVRTESDRVELTLRFDHLVIWQRALFYSQPER